LSIIEFDNHLYRLPLHL